MSKKNLKPALIVLEDGREFSGYSFTGEGETLGEVVFNTSMTGYQEVLTDPSYHGQIVTMTYPLIGNYGINPEDVESAGVRVNGFIVREHQPFHSNWRAKGDLASYLEGAGVMGLTGVDTRALTRHIRLAGAMKGIMSTEVDRVARLKRKLGAYPGLVGIDLVRDVTITRPYRWTDEGPEPVRALTAAEAWAEGHGPRVVVLDYGVKFNICRSLAKRGMRVVVVPSRTAARQILAMRPDGVMLSNGPGDPEPLKAEIKTVAELLGKVPVFGICLGHQLLGQALGGRTFKLKFGHRGANQPVKDLATGRIEITSQNHGFCVDPDSIPGGLAEVTHVNLNDNTNEGIRCLKVPAFSVQYHPEAAPGPHDASYLFDRFLLLMGKAGS